MKRFPYTLPEVGFIVLVMALPLAAGFVWHSETGGGLLGRVGVGMAVGFGVWGGLVYLTGLHGDRKKRDEETQA